MPISWRYSDASLSLACSQLATGSVATKTANVQNAVGCGEISAEVICPLSLDHSSTRRLV
ncbi:hypothetical protein [Aurantimonas phage AmM-1]|uniref:hypothetical protein n=1 Tax=Aurantimonas phage AmM-1 TaxID=1503929 RepID=UPI000540F84D|nr:hypothetical protein ACQ23_gp44 [Aurantimonas phage AmM-1]BAP94501.1 hypothetical protein [Aurantimonas phage AmM-1]